MVSGNHPESVHHDSCSVEQAPYFDEARVSINIEVVITLVKGIQHLAIISGIFVECPHLLDILANGVVLGDVHAVRDFLKDWCVVIDIQNGDVDAHAVRAWAVQSTVSRNHLKAVSRLLLTVKLPVEKGRFLYGNFFSQSNSLHKKAKKK